jgi:hypothetical protein
MLTLSERFPMSPQLFLQATTAAEHELREQLRQQYIEQAISYPADCPPAVMRIILALTFNQTDQQDAREKGDTAEEQQLIAVAQELEAPVSFMLWEHNLCQHFGPEIGPKLANQQVEVGMTLAMLGAAFGEALEDGMMVNTENGRTVLVYGKGSQASYFELDEHRIITSALVRGGATIPACVYEWPGLGF